MIHAKTLVAVKRERESYTLVNKSGVLFGVEINKDSGIMLVYTG